MTRSSLLAGGALVGASLLAWAVFAGDERDRLCVNGHPVKRATNVTYGGFEPQYGWERDHVIPLGLGGPDTASNVRYVACWRRDATHCVEGPAAEENAVEWEAEGLYCRGKVDLGAARKMVADFKGAHP